MGAQDNLSPQQFFHGTAHEFKPGDTVEPGHPGHAVSKSGYTYFGDVSAARTFGREAAARDKRSVYHVYEVEPTGNVENDPDSLWKRSASPLRVKGEHERGGAFNGSSPWWQNRKQSYPESLGPLG